MSKTGERKFSHYLIKKRNLDVYYVDEWTYGPRSDAKSHVVRPSPAQDETIVTVYVRTAPKKPKPRDFGWAWKQMTLGHSVRCNSWPSGNYIRLRPINLRDCVNTKRIVAYDDTGDYGVDVMSCSDILSNKWELMSV